MKYNKMMKFSLLVVLLCLVIQVQADKKIKVACIGNSITYGHAVANREKNSYPAQLQCLLDTGYEVKNFGVSGTTLLTKGDIPYVKTSAYLKTKEYQPDIVLIKLGTNDSKLRNRIHLDEFEHDYKNLINTYQSLASKPRIILLTPIPAFTQPDTVNITDEVIRKQIIPMIEKIAYETQVEIIHLYPLFSKQDNSIIPDKIHPSSIGQGMIAKPVFEQIIRKQHDLNVPSLLKINGTKSNFYGYESTDFKHNGVECKIVRPKKAAEGDPWIWRARFWGHEPQTDIALLDHGFHIAYCDVADLFGSPQAVKRWDDFYKLMTKGQLNKKVALEGMSRGGLIVYNWALKNPGKVACIYADAPVLDMKSWPMGNGIRNFDRQTVKTMLTAYGWTSEQEALEYKGNPIDQTTKIAKAGFPILHVCGDSDDVVPVSENTNPFAEKILQQGGNIRVVHKPGNHHPHSLKDPSLIVNFILQATGHQLRYTCIPTPGNEYRSGAGWKEGADWWANHEEISRVLAQQHLKLLLIGNSITQGFAGSRQLVTYKPGIHAMQQTCPDITWESAGISGDRTENVLFRILNGNYEKSTPENVVLTIGINNLVSGENSAEETADGIVACADALVNKMPESHIIVFCTLPSGKEADGELRGKIRRINTILQKELKNRKVTYVNLYDTFVNPDGSLKDGCFGGDYLHLTEKGYEVWVKEIRKQIK